MIEKFGKILITITYLFVSFLLLLAFFLLLASKPFEFSENIETEGTVSEIIDTRFLLTRESKIITVFVHTNTKLSYEFPDDLIIDAEFPATMKGISLQDILKVGDTVLVNGLKNGKDQIQADSLKIINSALFNQNSSNSQNTYVHPARNLPFRPKGVNE